MALPLLAPLVVTAVAAATAGWFGSRWWHRVAGSGPGRLDEGAADGNTPASPRRGTPRTMAWCGRCGSYVLPEHAKSCEREGCRHPG